MNFKILNTNQKQEILDKLKAQYGITTLPGMLIQRGTERIFLFQGSLTEKQIKVLEYTVPIERIGIYFAKDQHNQIRLSIDGVHLLQDQIQKGIIELNEEQMKEWMSGNELVIGQPVKGFVIMKYGNDFIGTGKASENKITNFIPKSRRLKLKD
ncbi:MAG: hypothetical protein KKB31_05800 [Nanoarchaeota archaeon]|nr:hypothetical protein [Nanoarchaeota archaeon]